MRGETSLTDAVKLAAGVSLTSEMRRVAGRLRDDAAELDSNPEPRPRSGLNRLRAGCARLSARAILAIAMLLSLPTMLDAEWPVRAIGDAPVATPRRVALVIGNGAYRYTRRLPNPRNDATDMGAALKKLGFLVIEAFDLDKAAFDGTIRAFAAALEGAEAGVLFYAGHGLQVSGLNYLVPVDAQLASTAALEFETVRLDVVQRTMESQAQTSILFVDACRDNPLSRALARAMSTRSAEIGRGLAPVEGGVGTLVSFSTQPGNVALDGFGRNSPFAGALVRHVAASSDDLGAILIAVRNDVVKATDRRQVPWEHSALTERFYFSPGARPRAQPPPAPLKLSEVAEAWGAVKDTANIAVLEAFRARYEDTFFAELARARIDEVERAAAGPPPAWP
jgi:uncharacterized caspase-like protein